MPFAHALRALQPDPCSAKGLRRKVAPAALAMPLLMGRERGATADDAPFPCLKKV